jgi:hypothetical protein
MSNPVMVCWSDYNIAYAHHLITRRSFTHSSCLYHTITKARNLDFNVMLVNMVALCSLYSERLETLTSLNMHAVNMGCSVKTGLY